MRKLLLTLCALALPLGACVPAETAPSTPSVTAPATYADKTKADEQAVVTAELSYKAFRTLVETGVKSGAIKDQTAGVFARIDNQLYTALQAVEAAYAAGNSENLTAAIARFNYVLDLGNKTLGGR